MWEMIREYLTFTRKERFGVLFLLLLISVLLILPNLFQPTPGDSDPATYRKLKDGIQNFESEHPDSPQKTRVTDHYPLSGSSAAKGELKPAPFTHEMHHFDPNKMKMEDWRRLGLSVRLSQTISRYIDRGGRFRKPEDLKKIYGLELSDYERLLPFVQIENRVGHFAPGPVVSADLNSDSVWQGEKVPIYNSSIETNKKRVTSFYTGKKMEITDINQSDSADWSRLPGIGSRLASRIIHFREKLGGFYQVDQVSETFGLPDTTFQKLKPALRLNSYSVVQLDVNSASRELLQSHPYVGWQLAKAIVAYRTQHGRFRTVDELLQIALLDTQKFGKLKHYLIVNP